MKDCNEILVDRLVQNGADPSTVGSILKTLSKILSENPEVQPAAANEKLGYLGWSEVRVDYHTLQLALACFELQGQTEGRRFGEDERSRQALRLRNCRATPINASDS